MFKVTVSSTRNLIEAKFSGLLTVDEVGEYDRALKALIKAGRVQTGFFMLIDLSECAIQPQAVLTAFVEHFVAMPKAQRLAAVVGQSIIKLQVRRVLTQSYMRICDNRAEALAWLTRTDAV